MGTNKLWKDIDATGHSHNWNYGFKKPTSRMLKYTENVKNIN